MLQFNVSMSHSWKHVGNQFEIRAKVAETLQSILLKCVWQTATYIVKSSRHLVCPFRSNQFHSVPKRGRSDVSISSLQYKSV